MQLDFEYSTTRKYLLGVVLLVFLGGAFKQGIFEIVHILSHQYMDGEYSYHSHHDDSENTDHDHFISDISKIDFEQFYNSSNNQDKRRQQSVDKTPKICTFAEFQIHQSVLKNRSIPIFNLQLPTSPYLQRITPPPEFANSTPV